MKHENKLIKLEQVLMYLTIFFVFFFFRCLHSVDYDASWFDSFEEKDNCKHKARMVDLSKEPQKCSTIATGTDDVQLEECKKSLKKKLISICPDSKIKAVYCFQ